MADATPQGDGLLWSARGAPASPGTSGSFLVALTLEVAASASGTGVVRDDWGPLRATGGQSHPFSTLNSNAAPHASDRAALAGRTTTAEMVAGRCGAAVYASGASAAGDAWAAPGAASVPGDRGGGNSELEGRTCHPDRTPSRARLPPLPSPSPVPPPDAMGPQRRLRLLPTHGALKTRARDVRPSLRRQPPMTPAAEATRLAPRLRGPLVGQKRPCRRSGWHPRPGGRAWWQRPGRPQSPFRRRRLVRGPPSSYSPPAPVPIRVPRRILDVSPLPALAPLAGWPAAAERV